MRKKLIWIGAAVVIVAIPAVVGLLVVGGDDRRAGALVQAGMGTHELKIDGLVVPGAAAGDVIEVDSWSWGVTNQVSSTTTTRTAGAAKFSELTVTKTVDNASPQLFLATSKGTSYPRVTLTSRKAAQEGQPRQDYLVITLEQVIITSVQFSGQGNDVPVEQVTLNFTRATMESKGTDSGGKLLSPSKATWDVTTQKGA